MAEPRATRVLPEVVSEMIDTAVHVLGSPRFRALDGGPYRPGRAHRVPCHRTSTSICSGIGNAVLTTDIADLQTRISFFQDRNYLRLGES